MTEDALPAQEALPPGVIAVLDEQSQHRLAGLIAGAVRQQGRALDEAIEGGLRHIPRPLRAVVRRALFR